MEIILTLLGTVIGVVLTKLTENYFDKKKETKLFIADIKDVLVWDWSSRDLLRHLISLDYETTENLNESNEGTPNQWGPVFFENPDCWKLLALRDKELVGYWSFFALNEETFEKAKKGELLDSEINLKNVIQMDKPGFYNIYFVIICVKEYYRKKGFLMLYESLIEKINELTETNRQIENICINAFTDNGKALAKNFGLNRIKKHKEFGEIYFGNFNDIKNSRTSRGLIKLNS